MRLTVVSLGLSVISVSWLPRNAVSSKTIRSPVVFIASACSPFSSCAASSKSLLNVRLRAVTSFAAMRTVALPVEPPYSAGVSKTTTVSERSRPVPRSRMPGLPAGMYTFSRYVPGATAISTVPSLPSGTASTADCTVG